MIQDPDEENHSLIMKSGRELHWWNTQRCTDARNKNENQIYLLSDSNQNIKKLIEAKEARKRSASKSNTAMH